MVRGSSSLLGRMEKSPASRGFFHAAVAAGASVRRWTCCCHVANTSTLYVRSDLRGKEMDVRVSASFHLVLKRRWRTARSRPPAGRRLPLSTALRSVRITRGGGVAGLAAALAVVRAGHRAVVLERDLVDLDVSPEGAFGIERRGIPHYLQPHSFCHAVGGCWPIGCWPIGLRTSWRRSWTPGRIRKI
jgi:hypothetical protein